jgi:putative peptidoglycan lipid II flippase
VGIALASTIAGWLNALMLGVTLARRGHYAPDARLRRRVPRIAAASILMGIVLAAIGFYVSDLFSQTNPVALRIALLAALVAVGIAVYFLVAEALGAASLREYIRLFRRGAPK